MTTSKMDKEIKSLEKEVEKLENEISLEKKLNKPLENKSTIYSVLALSSFIIGLVSLSLVMEFFYVEYSRYSSLKDECYDRENYSGDKDDSHLNYQCQNYTEKELNDLTSSYAFDTFIFGTIGLLLILAGIYGLRKSSQLLKIIDLKDKHDGLKAKKVELQNLKAEVVNIEAKLDGTRKIKYTCNLCSKIWITTTNDLEYLKKKMIGQSIPERLASLEEINKLMSIISRNVDKQVAQEKLQEMENELNESQFCPYCKSNIISLKREIVDDNALSKECVHCGFLNSESNNPYWATYTREILPNLEGSAGVDMTCVKCKYNFWVSTEELESGVSGSGVQVESFTKDGQDSLFHSLMEDLNSVIEKTKGENIKTNKSVKKKSSKAPSKKFKRKPDIVTIECPQCSSEIDVPETSSSQQIKCSNCGLEGEIEL